MTELLAPLEKSGEAWSPLLTVINTVHNNGHIRTVAVGQSHDRRLLS